MFQFAGEFIMIFPKTIYMSFDFGFNIVESVDYVGVGRQLGLEQSAMNCKNWVILSFVMLM